jgi:hypothetical protein
MALAMIERPEHDRRLIDRVSAPGFVEGLDGLPLAELLARIEASDRVVLEYSYVRRLLQGRLDIVDAVLAGGSGDPAAILPRVLAGSGDEAPNVRFRRSHLLQLLRSRLPEEMHGIAGVVFPAEPPIRVPEWIPVAGRREADVVLRSDLLSRLDEAGEAEVLEARRRLAAAEAEISAVRRRAFDAADALERAALRRLKAAPAPGEALRVVEWMCTAYLRHLGGIG